MLYFQICEVGGLAIIYNLEDLAKFGYMWKMKKKNYILATY
jgi:hypothetical protein